MHRQLLVLVAAFAVATLAAGSAFAQGPLDTAFTYQGRLEESGVPATGAFDFSFVLYDAPTGGAALGIDCLDGVPVSRGLFSVEIDFGSSPFGGDQRWMEIYVRPDGADACDENIGTYSLLSPRRELTPTPHARYSIEAGVARSATSLSAPDGDPSPAVYVDDEGRVGIGTTTPGQALAIDGAQSPVRAVTISATSQSAPRNFPGAAAQTPVGGGWAWGNFGNALADDGMTTVCTIPMSGTSGYLDLSAYGFALPPGATVLGVAISIDGSSDSNMMREAEIRLLGGSDVSADLALTSQPFGSRVVGGPEELWGLAWTPEQINAPAFGVRLRVAVASDFPVPFAASVDTISVTVYYLDDPPVATWTFGVYDGAFELAPAADLGAPTFRVDANANALLSGGLGSASLTIAADGDNVGEDGQPLIELTQDGGLITGRFGYRESTNDLRIETFGTAPTSILLNPQDGVGIKRTMPPLHPLQVGETTLNGNGAHVTAGGAWMNGSSREFKEGFEALDPVAILEKLVALPVTKWRYKRSAEGEHIGPTAEDFAAAFGLGRDDRYISTVDAAGVALAAIQGLNAKLRSELDAKQAEIDALRARNAAVDRDLEELRARLERLEARGGE